MKIKMLTVFLGKFNTNGKYKNGSITVLMIRFGATSMVRKLKKENSETIIINIALISQQFPNVYFLKLGKG